MTTEQTVSPVAAAVAKDRTVHAAGCPALHDSPGCTCVTPAMTLTVADICRRNDLSVARAELALTNLQEKGLVTGFIPGDVNAQITLTAEAAKYVN